MTRVRTGIERLVAGEVSSLRKGAVRVGVVANPTAVGAGFAHLVDILSAAKGIELAVIFGPEHGVRGDAQDMISVDSAADPRTGVRVRSLYGADEASLSPRAEDLEGLDWVVFDIQDVGSRYYTYVWTLVLVMRACAAARVGVIVLDRPNPIGGAVEGGAVEPPFRSFVGHMSVPNRHGMTAGEIARWANATDKIGCELEVVELEGWQRSMYYDDTDLPWVMPSPNMPTLDTALVYPGQCLIEGTELSEARGTTRPFEIFGAPYIDGYALADELRCYELPGVEFRPLGFLPQFQKHARTPCGGVQLHVTDRQAFLPYRTGVACLRAVKALYPDDFAWRTRAYEFVADRPAIDLLCGSEAVRVGIDRGDSLDALAATWESEQRAFAAECQQWLLYS